ncbi:WASH complex subunit 2-like [Watersipora subatra]|uniref:WASH complex subunit 2-like n=1 Tax=Watersipora subatra TaxID=2589382 RepID=UPI00355B4337
MDNFMRTYPTRGIRIQYIGTLTERAFGQRMTVANITSGFRSTGIFPLNTDAISDADYVPADVTDRTQTVVNEQVDPTLAQPSTSQTLIEKPSIPSTSRALIDEPSTLSTSNSLSLVEVTSKQPVAPQAISSSPVVAAATSKEPGTPQGYSSPAKSCSTKRWSSQKTAILTDTPEKERKEQEQTDRLNKTKKQPKRRPKRKEPESSSEDDEQSGVAVLDTDSDSPSEEETQEPDVPDVVVKGAFVVVKYQGKRSTIGYVGMVVGKDDGDWKVDFYKKTPQGTFSKPLQPDISPVETEQIVRVLGAPLSTGTTVRTLRCVIFGNKLDGMGFELR